MATEQPKNAPKHVNPLKGPTVVRYRDASRFLWGDRKSGEVADVVYGRNERIATLIYKLKPGGYFNHRTAGNPSSTSTASITCSRES